MITGIVVLLLEKDTGNFPTGKVYGKEIL